MKRARSQPQHWPPLPLCRMQSEFQNLTKESLQELMVSFLWSLLSLGNPHIYLGGFPHGYFLPVSHADPLPPPAPSQATSCWPRNVCLTLSSSRKPFLAPPLCGEFPCCVPIALYVHVFPRKFHTQFCPFLCWHFCIQLSKRRNKMVAIVILSSVVVTSLMWLLHA